jgi:hypothetical protein
MSNLTNLACVCPLCGAALAVTAPRSARATAWRFYDAAQDSILAHLFAAHEPAIEHSTIVALSALAVTGANSLQLSASPRR